MATTISSGRGNSPLLTANIADHGTIYGGRGLIFDGVSDYIINDSFTAHQTDTGTLSCWVKPANISSWRFYLGVGGIDSANVMRAIAQSDGTLWFIDNGSGWNTGISISIGNWYHLATTWNGTSIKFYVNGIGYSQTQSSILTPTGTDIIIGAKPVPTPELFGNATISDAKVFNATLTEAQVQELYLKPEQSAPSAVQDNLVAWYPMCEGNPDSPQSIVYDHSEKKLGSELVTSLTWASDPSNPYETLTSSGNTVTEADNTSGWGIASTSVISLTAGVLYKVTFNFTLNSGAVPNKVLIAVSESLGSAQEFIVTNVANGIQSHYFTVSSSRTDYRFGVRENDATNWSLSDLSIKPVLMGNHATTVFYGTELVTYPSFDTVTEHATNNNSWIDDTLDGSQEAELTQNTSAGNAKTGSNSGAVAMEATTCYLSYRKTDLTAGKTYYSEIYIKSGAGSGTGRMVIGTASRGEQVTPSEAPAVDFNTSGWSKIYATWVASQAEQFITIIFTNVALFVRTQLIIS